MSIFADFTKSLLPYLVILIIAPTLSSKVKGTNPCHYMRCAYCQAYTLTNADGTKTEMGACCSENSLLTIRCANGLNRDKDGCVTGCLGENLCKGLNCQNGQTCVISYKKSIGGDGMSEFAECIQN